MKYQTASVICSHCKKQVSVYSEMIIQSRQEYFFTCPYCGKESSLRGSIGIQETKLPKEAVRIKPR